MQNGGRCAILAVDLRTARAEIRRLTAPPIIRRLHFACKTTPAGRSPTSLTRGERPRYGPPIGSCAASRTRRASRSTHEAGVHSRRRRPVSDSVAALGLGSSTAPHLFSGPRSASGGGGGAGLCEG